MWWWWWWWWVVVVVMVVLLLKRELVALGGGCAAAEWWWRVLVPGDRGAPRAGTVLPPLPCSPSCSLYATTAAASTPHACAPNLHRTVCSSAYGAHSILSSLDGMSEVNLGGEGEDAESASASHPGHPGPGAASGPALTLRLPRLHNRMNSVVNFVPPGVVLARTASNASELSGPGGGMLVGRTSSGVSDAPASPGDGSSDGASGGGRGAAAGRRPSFRKTARGSPLRRSSSLSATAPRGSTHRGSVSSVRGGPGVMGSYAAVPHVRGGAVALPGLTQLSVVLLQQLPLRRPPRVRTDVGELSLVATVTAAYEAALAVQAGPARGVPGDVSPEAEGWSALASPMRSPVPSTAGAVDPRELEVVLEGVARAAAGAAKAAPDHAGRSVMFEEGLGWGPESVRVCSRHSREGSPSAGLEWGGVKGAG
jgi:hypothetical protein